MHPQSPALTIGRTVLKESDDIILGVIFDSKMIFEKHLCSVSRAASQRLGILRKSWQVFHDRLLFWRCYRGFVLPVFEYFSAISWVVSGASFLTVGVFECDLAHCRSVAVCMLYKIRCNPMHPLYGALPVPYVPVQVACGAVIAHWYTYAPPCCRTSRYCQTFLPLSVSLWNDFSDPLFDGVGLAGFKSRANAFLLV